MDERIEQEITETVEAAERKQALKSCRQIGSQAAAFVAGAMDCGFDFDQGAQLYGTYVEATAAANHCHHDEGREG